MIIHRLDLTTDEMMALSDALAWADVGLSDQPEKQALAILARTEAFKTIFSAKPIITQEAAA